MLNTNKKLIITSLDITEQRERGLYQDCRTKRGL